MASLIGAVITAASTSTHPSWVDVGTFAVAAAIVLAGAIGVVVARNPVHSALMLVMTLFGIAVLFVLEQASFLAAVQVIVYAGAIVVLFLFVIMFLGVDREENIAAEPLRGQRPLAVGLVALGTTGLLLLGQVSGWTTGAPHVAGSDTGAPNVNLLGKAVYTTYLFPFEATAALLIIAVVGAVVLARRPPGAAIPVDDEPLAEGADHGAGPGTDEAGGESEVDGAADGPGGGASDSPAAPAADAADTVETDETDDASHTGQGSKEGARP
jgi:NADH-quinone oxidoreductase subunit J